MRDLTNRVRRLETLRGVGLDAMSEHELDALIADLESTDGRRHAQALERLVERGVDVTAI